MRKKGFVLAIVGVFVMSFESTLVSLSSLKGFDFLFVLGITLLISTIVLMKFDKQTKPLFSHKKALFLASLSMGLSNICFVNAVKLTNISTTVLILATTPIVSALLDTLFTKTKSPKSLFISAFFVIIGVAIILKDSQKELNLLGVILAFCVVFLFSTLYIILSHTPNLNRYSQISLSAIIIAVLSLPFVNFSDFGARNLSAVLIMGLLVTPISRLLIGNASKYILSAEVGLIIMLESLLAPIWGWIFVGQKVSKFIVFGGGLIVFAVVFYTLTTAFIPTKTTTKHSKKKI
ncbi:MAG: DMT family transporter [Campylobacter sp.]|nr:DMT family transporter [Campylobacter sp.]